MQAVLCLYSSHATVRFSRDKAHLKNDLKHSVKPVFKGHSKIGKTNFFKTNGSLMKVRSIAECSLGAFCNTFDLHYMTIGLESQFLDFFLSGRLRQVLLNAIRAIT